MFCPGLITEDMGGPLTGDFLTGTGPDLVTGAAPFPFAGLFGTGAPGAFGTDGGCEVDSERVPDGRTGTETEDGIRGGVPIEEVP